MAEAEHVAALHLHEDAGRKVRAPQGKTLRNTESPVKKGKESATERETTSDFLRRKGEKVSR